MPSQDVDRLAVGREGHRRGRAIAHLRPARGAAGGAATGLDARGLGGVAPAHRLQPLEPPHRDVEQQADEADQHHARDDQVVALAGVARVDDQEAEARVDGDHLGRHHDQPGDAEREAQRRR